MLTLVVVGGLLLTAVALILVIYFGTRNIGGGR